MEKNKTQSTHNTKEKQSSDIEKLQRPQSFPKLPLRQGGRQGGRQESTPPKGESNNPPKKPKKTSKE